MTIRFDDAWRAALDIANDAAKILDTDVIVIRDLLGRSSIVVDVPENDPQLRLLRERLRESCGLFAGQQPILVVSGLFAPDHITGSPDRHPVPGFLADSRRVNVIERGTVGADWLRVNREPVGARVALYGFKGGVGRSTATFVLARHLARQGKAVLVVDLDLESPGVSALLRADLQYAEHGVVDYLAEAAVGNEADLDLVTRSDAVGELPGNGEVWLASAGGRPREGYSYLEKLNRAYLDLPSTPENEGVTFGRRLADAITACENQVANRSRQPEIVLLDCRSGIHDVAAVAITQLSTLALLFATDNPHTWHGYHPLFKQWRTSLDTDTRHRIGTRLKMVASMVPSIRSDDYLRRFVNHAQDCFGTTLYGNEEGGVNLDGFNFAADDRSAPHYPLSVPHSSELVGIDPSHNSSWASSSMIDAVYRDFVIGVAAMLKEENAALPKEPVELRIRGQDKSQTEGADVTIGQGAMFGKGLYAARNFKKGEIVVTYELKRLTFAELKALSPEEYAATHNVNGQIYLYPKPARYVNHSKNPNTRNDHEQQADIALRDIRAGELITVDAEYDDIPVLKKVASIVAKVPSIEQGLDFYREQLGMQTIWKKEDILRRNSTSGLYIAM